MTLAGLLIIVAVVAGLGTLGVTAFRTAGTDTDAEATSTVAAAETAIEHCRAAHGGDYSSCSKRALLAIQPELADAGDRLTVSVGADTFAIAVQSQRDPNVVFKLSRRTDGATTRTVTGTW